MYTVDLHLKGETVASALVNLQTQINLAKKTKEKTLCLIVGYGSSGGSHKIKTAVLSSLRDLREKKQIKGFIEGSKLDIFSLDYQNLKGKEFIEKQCFIRKNPGEIIVVL